MFDVLNGSSFASVKAPGIYVTARKDLSFRQTLDYIIVARGIIFAGNLLQISTIEICKYYIHCLPVKVK